MPLPLLAVGLITTAVGTGLNYALSSKPGTPDVGAGQREGTLAEAQTLPLRRQIERAAQLGEKILRPGYQKVSAANLPQVAKNLGIDINRAQQEIAKTQVQQAPGTIRLSGQGRPGPQAKTEAQAKQEANTKLFGGLQQSVAGGGSFYIDGQGNVVPESEAYIDFTGLGEADSQAKMAQEMARLQLDLSKKYGTKFVDEARKQLELADPEGTKARNMAYDLIQSQIEDQPNRPVADMLDSQVADELASGNRLNGVSADLLDQAIMQAAGSRGAGNSAGYPDYRGELESGFAGQNRLRQSQQKALGWLSSGSTPEDIQYRREQQNMANLGAFANGQSPVTQFRNLSGAQQGATPMIPGQTLSRMTGSAGDAGQQAAMSNWGTNLAYGNTQTNDWMGGLSMLLQGLNTAGKAGWKPLA